MWKIPGSLVPIVLGTVQSARNFGYWKVYHLWSRISTCIYGTLRVFTALLSLAEHGAPKYVKNRSRAPKDVVPFLCVRRFMFTWAMDHGYEIIALAAQLPEPKHAKCINADQKKNRMPGTIHQCNKRSWNDISQLILWLYLHKGHRCGLRPPILQNPWTKTEKNTLIHQPKGVGCQKVLFKTD